jgi:Phosphotransferase enzyme family
MRLALALTSPCRPAAVRKFSALAGALRIAEAAHVTPASFSFLDADFGIGMVDERFVDLLDVLVRRFGPLVDLAVYKPRQVERSGSRLLLFGTDGPVAFVKICDDEASRVRETAILAAIDQPERRRAISTPRLLDQGFDADLNWFATTPLPDGTHRPATMLPSDEIERLVAPLSALFAAAPAAPAPAGWTPMHGDLTPWNLRWVAGQMWLFDWEHARLAPPGADAVWFRATTEVVRGRPAGSADEAGVQFWTRIVTERLEEGSDIELQERLLSVLESMRTNESA